MVIIDDSDNIDRISGLPDDLLLEILEKLAIDAGHVHTVARTCILSRRWRSLPASVSWPHITNFSLDAGNFFSLNGKQIATPAFTSALRRFLAVPSRNRIVATLILKLILTKHERDDNVRRIGALVGDAIDTGRVKRIELDVVGLVDLRLDWLDELPIKLGYGERFQHLLPAGACFRSAVTKLSLEHVWFRDPAVVNDLVQECNALRFLSLSACGFLPEGDLDIDEAPLPVLIIDAPQSRLSSLQCIQCYIDHVDLVQAPALRMFRCDDWLAENSPPVSFGYTASLQGLFLNHRNSDDDNDGGGGGEDGDDDDVAGLKLSNVLVKGEQLLGLFLGFQNGKVRVFCIPRVLAHLYFELVIWKSIYIS